MKKIAWVMMVAFLLVSGISSTVKAATVKEEVQFTREEYKEMEKEYVHQIRLILLEKGCKDAGITLTYVITNDEERQYTVTIHHKELDNLTGEEFSLLRGRIEDTGKNYLFCETKVKCLS